MMRPQGVPPVPTLERGTVGQGQNCGTPCGTERGTGGLKALAIKSLQSSRVGQSVGQVVGQTVPQDRGQSPSRGTRIRAVALTPWPEPEPFPLAVRSEPWKYACLWAIVSHFGAGLMKDAVGTLILACPDTMPQEAVQAAQEGLSELAEYIQVLLDRGAS